MISRFHSFMRCSTGVLTKAPTEDDAATCSGRGDCLNGTCLCEIRYSGDECTGFNLPYHVGISTVFYFVALISVIQLLICIVAEYQRLKQPTILRACRVTTQKLLYFVVFIAALLRAAYFTKPEVLQPGWANTLMSAYYPLLMTCASLVVCLWAEIFHLRDIRWERSQFLSKSFLGFLAFNLFLYSLFGAEVFSSLISANRQTYAHIFNGCYAALLLIVVIFFLIYGVEVFFKIRGGFVYDHIGNSLGPGDQIINASQLHQSRVGLLSQAIMLIIIVGFLTSETLGDFWKKKVPVYSRNWHDIVFRIAEIGVALWFPCCLWNSMAPEQLWILNPRKLLSRQIDPSIPTTSTEKRILSPEEGQSFLTKKDCWICYDSDKTEPLIQPCKCTGDVSSVHHDCLRRWLVESCSTSDAVLKCKVCGSPYEIERNNKLDWEKGFTVQHWAKTVILVTLMCITGACAWIIIQLYVDPIVRVLTAGCATLVAYVCIKLLGENTVVAYQRAKVSSINIVTNESTEKLQTICQEVECK
uniref:Putative the ring-variant domain is a c4hc3 zinc-finger like motif found in a number of cellular n=1 Tax=Tabanus bromius TaxID=304241 RepID=A0A0K8TT33_TABBR